MPRPTLAKKKPKRKEEFRIPEGLGNLSESEIDGLMKMGGRKGPAITAEEGTVSMKEHGDKVAELEGRIAKLTEKVDTLQKEKGAALVERDEARKSLETARRTIEGLEGELSSKSESLKSRDSRIAGLTNDVQKLREGRDASRDSELRSKDEELQRVQRRAEKAEATVSELRDRLEAAERALEESEGRVAELEARIGELGSRDRAAPVGCIRGSGEAEWKTVGTALIEPPGILTSDLLEDGRYKVVLSKDGSYLRFWKDVTGKCTAEGGRIRMPALAGYIDLKSSSKFDVAADGSGYRVILW